MMLLQISGAVLDKIWKNSNPCIEKEEDKIESIKNIDWKQVLSNSSIIADSINIIKQSTYDIEILTKVHSLEEARNKVIFLRNNGINNKIVFVPYLCKKTDIVTAYKNILIDDNTDNLKDWQEHGGIPILFDKSNLIVQSDFIITNNLNILKRKKN